MDARARHTAIIKRLANELGFDACGIAKARFLNEEAPHLEQWLNNNYHGQMAYMANHFDKRLDPQKLVPGAKSVVSLLYNYFPEQDLAQQHGYKLAKYAYGKDYHEVIKEKLFAFLNLAQAEIGDIDGRVFVDSAPVMERQWAQLAGLGWLGKNGLLLNKTKGSFLFIAELIIDLDLDYDSPIPDYCGTCTKCIDACPTEAIVEPGVVNGSKCISHYTIELKSEMPITEEKPFADWVFGCDICQDVCPWNRFSQPHNEPAFIPNQELQEMKAVDWQELTQESFNKVFKVSAVKRAKFAGLKRNLDFVMKQNH
jgi:epoxyqueuosine reductase